MMTSRRAAHVAPLVALLLSGIGVSPDRAVAEDNCLDAPGSAAPDGQHWYYRIDRVQHRKCWYLHAMAGLPNRAAKALPAIAPAPAPSAAALHTSQGAFPARPLEGNSTDGASTDGVPQVTVLAIKPVPAFLVDTKSESRELPKPQISQANPNVPPQSNGRPAEADSPRVPGTSETAHHALAQVPSNASAPVRTGPRQLFFLLALALAVAAALTALISKMVRLARTPRCSDHPDDVYRRFSLSSRRANEAFTPEGDAAVHVPHGGHGTGKWEELYRPSHGIGVPVGFG